MNTKMMQQQNCHMPIASSDNSQYKKVAIANLY